MKAFDMANINKNNEKDIIAYFKGLDDKCDRKNFFEDPREKIKNEATDLLVNGIEHKYFIKSIIIIYIVFNFSK